MENTGSIDIENTTSPSDHPNIPFEFDGSYKGDELTQKVADILCLKDVGGWRVIDSDGPLAMVHYDDGADMGLYGHLRGVLVDVETGTIIADSFGYTPTAVESEIKEENGIINIRDQNNINHVFDAKNTVIKRVFEGVVIRVIWYKGKCYRITHRKINPARSRWGSSKTFISMYEEAGGPTAEQLFDTSKPYSSTCYDFLVVDKSLLVGTRQKVDKTYLVLLAVRDMVDIAFRVPGAVPGIPSFEMTDTIRGTMDKSVIHNPKQLSLADANYHLKYGYFREFTPDDYRQLTGEAIIMYTMNGSTVEDIVKVHSPSYEWRINRRGDNPNITNRFYALLSSVYPDIDSEGAWETFKKNNILFPLYDEQSLRDLYDQSKCILTLPTTDARRENYSDRNSRIHLLWINYVLSLPSNVQGDAINILTQFKKDRDDLIAWIQNLEASTKNIEDTELPPRVKGIISSSRRLAQNRVKSGNNYGANGTYMKLPVIIKSTIRNLINKENGPSLYALVRSMKESRKPPAIKQESSDITTEIK